MVMEMITGEGNLGDQKEFSRKDTREFHRAGHCPAIGTGRVMCHFLHPQKQKLGSIFISADDNTLLCKRVLGRTNQKRHDADLVRTGASEENRLHE